MTPEWSGGALRGLSRTVNETDNTKYLSYQRQTSSSANAAVIVSSSRLFACPRNLNAPGHTHAHVRTTLCQRASLNLAQNRAVQHQTSTLDIELCRADQSIRFLLLSVALRSCHVLLSSFEKSICVYKYMFTKRLTSILSIPPLLTSRHLLSRRALSATHGSYLLSCCSLEC